MKSICIKTNNKKSIDYLLNKLENYQFDDICFSLRNFKSYNNIIIHYTGKNNTTFVKEISHILSHLIIELYQDQFIKNLILNDYFYFDSIERTNILEITTDDLVNDEEAIYTEPEIYKILFNIFYEHLKKHHSIYLKGFITFRLKEYLEILSEQIDKSVNKFIIQREYDEFISILKLYVNTEETSCDLVHLIYIESKPLLLDSNKNIIKIDENMFNSKYLSDISFSTSDYILNTLLNLLPKKIYIHLIDNTVDEFINTLKLVFEDRVIYCTECNLCNIYRKNRTLNVKI